MRYLDRNGVLRHCTGRRMGFAYRSCAGLDGGIVLKAGLAVEPASPAMVRKRIDGYLAKRAWLAGMRCAGSVFKNSDAGEPTGALLDRLGFKGRSVGGARVSVRHANVIELGSDATASDVAALVEQIKLEVKDRMGMVLQEEVVRFE